MLDFMFYNTAAATAPILHSVEYAPARGRRSKSFRVRKDVVLVAQAVAMPAADDGTFSQSYYDTDSEPAEYRPMGKALSAQFEAHAAAKAMLDRLDELCRLEEGWDGYDALPIEKAAYRNTAATIMAMRGRQAMRWNLFPGTNGTLLLTAKGSKIASVSIGNDDFSYFAMGSNGSEARGQQRFTPKAMAEALKQIEDVLEGQ